MNTWLQAAYVLSRLVPPAGLTAKAGRRGGATAAHRSGADRLLICRCVDWDPAGTTFEDSYFDPGLVLDSAAAANLFGDLRVSPRSFSLASFLGVCMVRYMIPKVKCVRNHGAAVVGAEVPPTIGDFGAQASCRGL
jgi:hypothetical protein